MKFEAGNIIIATLHSPREKIVGVLNDITAAGITVRSIDLRYFDDWTQAIAAGEPHLKMTNNFFPMWRVERMSWDESTDDIPSLADQFFSRSGLRLEDQ